MNEGNAYRKSISEGLIRLRSERRLTQSELARFLELSQQRLSEIERGRGSIAAEQLVFLLQKFNLPLTYFVTTKLPDEEIALQNALARLGAEYLRESSDVIVPEQWDRPDIVILAVLCDYPVARLIPALAPLIVFNIQKINFNKIERALHDLGFAERFYWVQEATLQAIQHRLSEPHLPRNIKSLYRRARTALAGVFLRKEPVRKIDKTLRSEDFLDPDIISEKTREIVKKDRDTLARKWNIITRIRQSDFEQALIESETYV